MPPIEAIRASYAEDAMRRKATGNAVSGSLATVESLKVNRANDYD